MRAEIALNRSGSRITAAKRRIHRKFIYATERVGYCSISLLNGRVHNWATYLDESAICLAGHIATDFWKPALQPFSNVYLLKGMINLRPTLRSSTPSTSIYAADWLAAQHTAGLDSFEYGTSDQ